MINKTGILLLLFCHFLVFSQRIIYVGGNSGGNGTQGNPYSSFRTAVANAQDGDEIKLVSYVQDQSYIQNGSEVQPLVIDKAITIDGQNNRLKIVASPLSLTKNVVFKNLKLELPPLDNLTDAFSGQQEKSNFIYANGNRVEFNNVSTNIEGGHPNTRPIIFAGTYKNTSDAGNAEIVIVNSNPETKFKAIIAGNRNSDKSTPTTINIGGNTQVGGSNYNPNGGVYFGGGETLAGGQSYRTIGKVTVISEAVGTDIYEYNGVNSSDHILELRGDRYGFPRFTQIKNLALTNGSSGNHSRISGSSSFTKIVLGNGYTMNLTDDTPNFNTILEGKGGTIKLKKGQKLNVNGKITGIFNLNIVCENTCNFSEGEVFIEGNSVSDADVNISFTPDTNDFTLVKVIKNGQPRWEIARKNPVRNLQSNFDSNSKNMTLTWQKPDGTNGLTGYEIYKGGSKIREITDINQLSYVERITANGTYEYSVYAVYGNSKSDAVNIQVNITTIQDNQPTLPNNSYLGRVGINTDEPEATLHIKEEDINILPISTPQGALFPSFSTEERTLFENVVEGTMIYNTTHHCLEIYIDGNWKCIKLK
ncbi:MAG: fibronectin type III domain-containing protein [Flavobacteriaceae bacterium]|nr:fibronectin type III domain-containing protein [Flavobacteriaceae bacterium]